MQAGTLLGQYPVEIEPSTTSDVLADFTVNGGGIGHLPVIIKGALAGQELKVQRWSGGTWTDLEGVDLDNNSYYQGILNPDGTMDYVFSIPRPSLDLNAAWRVRVMNTDPAAPLTALGKLTDPPTMYVDDISTTTTGVSAGESKAIYFTGKDYLGSPTRVYARIGLPAGASAANPVPGVVLVHGGGGTAFSQWVELWRDRGYAAISIAVEGQTDIPATQAQKDAGLAVGNWLKHAMPGPARVGVYGDSNVDPIADQWMYHAVADTILANLLLQSLPEVASDQVGLMGISWGGVITSTVIGIDDRFSFAVPVYGCGSMADADNWWGDTLGNNELYKTIWDPMVRIQNVTMPVLWLSWPEDSHFPLDSQADCYTNAPGPHMVSLIPGMGHGHSPAWNRPESYAFADAINNEGTPWCTQQSASLVNDAAEVTFLSTKPLEQASVISTLDGGFTGDRIWTQTTATLVDNGAGSYTVTASVPTYATAWFVNVQSGSLVASSDYQETGVTPAVFTLSYAAGPNGSISGTSPQLVQYGADGSAVTAVADPGYHFVNWSDGLTVNPRIDSSVTADINVTANFEIDTFTLSYTAGPNGSISGPSSQVVEHGADGAAVTALADSGYHFVNWSDGSTDNPRTDTGVMGNVAVTANFEVDPPLSDLAGAEITLLGTISAGTITDTHTSDNTYQILTETESGGKRNRRRSQLEHKWIFDVTGGELVTFFVEAHHTVNAEGDHFVFSYSTDDINYTDMLTVTKTADDDSSNFFVLPGDLSGTVYVRVVDTDRTQGNRALDSLYVDSLSIVSESASEAPTGATDPNPIDGISNVTVNTVLSWTPSLLAASNNVYFGLNPTPGAAEFQLNQTTNSFEPGPLEYNTTYYWAIDEVNSAGTAYGPVWSFTTGGAIPEMHVSSIEPGVQRKGKSYHGVVIVSVVDSTSGQAVVGATVQGVFSGVFNQSLSAVTDSSGRAVLTTSAKERLPFSYTFTVTEVNATNYLYQPANNIETSDSGSF